MRPQEIVEGGKRTERQEGEEEKETGDREAKRLHGGKWRGKNGTKSQQELVNMHSFYNLKSCDSVL